MSKVKQGVSNAVKAGASVVRHTARVVEKVSKNPKVSQTAGKVASVASKVYDIAKTINHPEWYTAYATDNLINLNFGLRKELPVYGNTSVPAIMAIDMVNMIPCSRTTLDEDLQVDPGWKSGIDRLFTAIRAANSSTAPYTVDDLEKYVFNVCALHIAYCSLRRMYAALYNFEATDGRMPEALAEALGMNYDDFLAHAADLRMYGNMFSLEIAAKYPLKVNLIERYRWLTSNIFRDGTAVKESFYVCDFLHEGAVRCYDGLLNKWSRTGLTRPAKYVEVITTINDLRAAIAGNQTNAAIAAEILKAFGQDAVYVSEIWPDNMAVPVVDDTYMLSQLQNAWSPLRDLGESQDSKAQDWRTVIETAPTVPDSAVQNVINILNGLYINTQKNNMTPGETLSVMRLAAYSHAVREEDTGNISIGLLAYQTELVVGMRIVTSGGTDKDITDPDTVPLPMITANFTVLAAAAYTQIQLLGFQSFLMGCFEYHPRSVFMVYSDTDIQTGFYSWDFDNYAEYPSISSFISMNSYANMSLLYVPKIVKQTNWEAIKV